MARPLKNISPQQVITMYMPYRETKLVVIEQPFYQRFNKKGFKQRPHFEFKHSIFG